jgi:hypothetical protein
LSCTPSEDVELLLHAARLFPSAHHRSTVAYYRRYPNSLSRKGSIMLPAILGVMRRQREIVKPNPRLLNACRQGEAFWRDYFGWETIKEIYAKLAAGAPGPAARSFGALLWYVRGRLFLFPWKYGRRMIRFVRRRFGLWRNSATVTPAAAPPVEQLQGSRRRVFSPKQQLTQPESDHSRASPRIPPGEICQEDQETAVGSIHRNR